MIKLNKQKSIFDDEDNYMDFITHTIKTPKEASEAIQRLVDLIKTIKAGISDGLGPEDMAPIMGSLVSVMSEFSDYKEIRTELSNTDAVYDLGSIYFPKLIKALVS